MGFWQRLKGTEEKPPALPVAVVGAGVDAERLLAAYAAVDGCAPSPVDRPRALELIRQGTTAAVEICLPPAEGQEVALAALRAGLFVSIPCPARREDLKILENAAAANRGALRLRLLPFYYPPYLEMKRLLDEDVIGAPSMLKLAVRYGQGITLPDPLDPAAWVRERELGFLALAGWLMGPAAQANARCETVRAGSGPASAVLTWKFEGVHKYGYLQLDFCPGLHVRTFTEPIHRQIELTGVGGVVFATRGEGQLMRQPPLIVRGKTTATSFENLTDDWREIYPALARETAAAVRDGSPVRATAAHAEPALSILELAGV